jgi:60 kDa SS-A/Ro ribonucleoprotein
MKTNVRVTRPKTFTHEGAPAQGMTNIQALRRSVLSCLLWENEFYEDGVTIANRIQELCKLVKPEDLAALAVEARTVHHLRHVPLLLLRELVRNAKGRMVGDAIAQTIHRADEITEFLALYWKEGKTPLAKQVKLGLARAMQKFSAYQLAKYDRDGAVKLRDVAFLVHAKPKNDVGGRIYANLVNRSYIPENTKSSKFPVRKTYELPHENVGLPVPDTWEVALSAGEDKKESFERLLKEGKLGYLALLKNLRGMTQAGVDEVLIVAALLLRKGAEQVFPFRYVAAARACPSLEPAVDQALQAAIKELPKLEGKTVVLVDVSGSMDNPLSSKSDLTRVDAAAALASIVHGDLRVFTFSDQLIEVPARRGMAGVDAIVKSQLHHSTELAEAVQFINQKVPHDRLICITDEQATVTAVPAPVAKRAYMINVASAKNGVGYKKWIHLDGFSESVIRWIYATEHGE